VESNYRAMCCLGLAGLLVAAAVADAPMGAVLGSPHGLKHFKPLEDYDVALEFISPETVFQAGRPAWLGFRLKNNAKKTLLVTEWRQDLGENKLDLSETLEEKQQSGNLRIRYAPCTPDGKRVTGEWQAYAPTIPGAVKRVALELHHGNATLMDMRLPFVETATKGGHFLLQAELGLTSLHAKSREILITVKK